MHEKSLYFFYVFKDRKSIYFSNVYQYCFDKYIFPVEEKKITSFFYVLKELFLDKCSLIVYYRKKGANPFVKAVVCCKLTAEQRKYVFFFPYN